MEDGPSASAAAASAPAPSLTEEKDGGAADADDDDDEEGTIVQEEFKIWKKNAPYLCQQHSNSSTAERDEQRAQHR